MVPQEWLPPMTIPNWISLVRLLLIPVFAWYAVRYGNSVSAGAPEDWLRGMAVGVFLFAACTDGIDGYIARHYNLRSRLGSVLDPLADKGLMFTAFITLSVSGWSQIHRLPWLFPFLAILRDVLSAIGAWMIHHRHGRVRVKPHWTGKVANVAQIVAVAWVMLKLEFIHPTVPIGIAMVFTVISGWMHLYDGALQYLHGPPPQPMHDPPA